ncbi:ubiquinone biosynthesis methyltransferase UbiE [Aminobacter sp. Piv2-1]|uniref:ubiquinone biosynthesis methyltransferase UbiE n=1 Tax=Aminobacter sp. Piv2-1 TaxID=3031122 RepID=UPI0030A7E147
MSANAAPQQPGPEREFGRMIQLDMDVTAFLSNWMNCDYISNYVARAISHNRPDSVLFSNLFSSAFNELLEVAFRTRHPGGVIACKVSRHAHIDRIELAFACTSEERQFYEKAILQAQSADAQQRYLNSLSGDTAPSRDMVLLELAVDYEAALWLETSGEDRIALVVDLPLGGSAH